VSAADNSSMQLETAQWPVEIKSKKTKKMNEIQNKWGELEERTRNESVVLSG
jgi:hypothetical protein